MMPMGYEYGFTPQARRGHDAAGGLGRAERRSQPVRRRGQFDEGRRAGAQRARGRSAASPRPTARCVGAAAGRRTGDVQRLRHHPDQSGPRTARHVDRSGPLLAETGGLFDGFARRDAASSPQLFRPGEPIELAPLEVRVFRGNRSAHPRSRAAPTARRGSSESRHAGSAGRGPHRDRGGLSGTGWRPLRDQADGRRHAGGLGRHLPRRPRQDRRLPQVPRPGRRTSGARRRWPSSTTTAGSAVSRSRGTAATSTPSSAWRDLFADWRSRLRQEARRRPEAVAGTGRRPRTGRALRPSRQPAPTAK